MPDVIPDTRIHLADGSHIWLGGYCQFQQQWTNNPHRHPQHHEICLVLSGSGLFQHRSDQYDLGKGSLFFSELHITHEISSPQTRDLEIIFIVWEPGNKELISPEMRVLEQFWQAHHLCVADQQHLLQFLPLFHHTPGVSPTDTFHRQAALQAFFLSCCASLTVTRTAPALITRQPLMRAQNFIRQQLNSTLSVGDVATAAGLSERQLRRLFQKEVGTTVVQAITDERLRQATRLLMMRFAVKEAGDRVGIGSASLFSRLFKKRYGVGPRDWQRAHAPAATAQATEFGQHPSQ